MSRYEVKGNGHTLAYGADHVFGLFVQVFEDGNEEPVIDLDKENRPDLDTTMIETIADTMTGQALHINEHDL